MKRISDRFMQLAVLFALIGMGLGIKMGITENFTLAPVHAHINLLGWVSMMLYGLFYRAVPRATAGVLPVVHFWVAVISAAVSLPLLAMFLTGQATNKAVFGLTAKQIGPIMGPFEIGLWVGMLTFAIIVWRSTWKAEA
jgi:cbb3-type cytochrome oxidase subunit 1